MNLSATCVCVALAAASVLFAGCKSDEIPTAATPVTPTQVAAPPVFTEEFTAVVPVSGSRFYSFSVTQFGTVNVTLTSVGGAFVPPTVTMGFGIGIPNAEGCATTTSVTTRSGSTAQLIGAYAAGVYCVVVSDVGNLFAPATVTVSIAFP